MQRQRSAPSDALAASTTAVPGLKATPTPSSCSRASAIVVAESPLASTWNVTLSPPARALRDVLVRLLDHQMDVDDGAALVDDRSDRLKHDWADRDRFDEVPVADV